MFIFWNYISWTLVILAVYFFFFISLESPLLFWFILEGGVWGIFFFFLKGEDEEKNKKSMNFFIIQGLCSLAWITMILLEEDLLTSIFIPLVIYLKMGLIPGHGWVWKIYEGGNLYLIFMISFFQKIPPLGLVIFSVMVGKLSTASFLTMIILNLILVIYIFFLESNFFVFLFSSGILHFNNMVLLLISGKNLEVALYFFSYVVTLFLGLVCVWNFQKSFLSPQSSEPYWGGGMWMLVSLSMVGFPPSMMFFIKLIFLMSGGGLISSFFILFFVFIFLTYMMVMASSLLSFIHYGFTPHLPSWDVWEKASFFKLNSFFLLVSTTFFFFSVMFTSLLMLEMKKEFNFRIGVEDTMGELTINDGGN